MKSLIRYKFAYVLLVILVMLSVAMVPKPAHAWSAVTVEAEGSLFNIWNAFRDFFSHITGKESPQIVITDKGTHQLMMRLAYQFLETDPAYLDQKEYLPTIDGILDWEGVVAKTDRVILNGGEWRGNGKSGGPDAAGKSKDSNHYLNPRLEDGKKGNADTSVQSHFENFLLQMYNQGDFYNRNKPNDDTNHNAAWAAHYLGDVYVPYHTAGKFANDTQVGILTPAEAGPAYLYQSDEAVLVDGEINPDSIVKPPEWSGLDNDFTDIYSYFKSEYRGNGDKDWFDPWYYNGIKGLGPNTVLGSHQLWESWAHTYITENNLYKVPAAYSADWKNATPKFNSALSNIENQAAQAKAFTLAAAVETSYNMATYTKMPDIAFNKATQRVATLWRASITALRPEIKVTPDAGNPNLLKVTATIKSLEPNDPATNVQAKLTVEGGTVRGKDIHDTDESARVAIGKPVPGTYNPATVTPDMGVTVTREKPWVTEWQVDTNNPDTCKLKLEVVCEYKKTPDLQYAVCEPVAKPPVTTSSALSQYKSCKIEINANAPCKYNSGTKISDMVLVPGDGNAVWNGSERYFDGGFTGNTFNGNLRLGSNDNGTGKIKISVEPTGDPAVFTITSYSVDVDVVGTHSSGNFSRRTEEFYLSGHSSIDAHLDAYGRDWLTATVSGADVCKDITSYTFEGVSLGGTRSWTIEKLACDSGSLIDIQFSK
jgi:hypothetical protein